MQALLTRRRNRISLSCVECRRRKTKCDKKKPQCTRCAKAGNSCNYTHNKGNHLSSTEGDATGNLDATVSSAPFSTTPLSSSAPPKDPHIFEPIVPSQRWHDLSISLDDSEDTIVAINQRSYPHKPNSIMAMSQRDRYLRAFIGSVWGCTISAGEKSSSDLKKGEKSVYHFVGDIIQHSRVRQKDNSFSALMQYTLFARGPTLENSLMPNCPLPDELAQTLTEIQNIIPTIPAVELLLKYFYSTIYPIYPFLDVATFENCIRCLLLKTHDMPSKYKIELNPREIRKSLENLCILLVVLKLAHAAMSRDRDPLVTQVAASMGLFTHNTVPDQALAIMQKCLLLLNITTFTSEDSLCCLLYYWVHHSLLGMNATLRLPSQVVLALDSILQLATILRLHKDPSSFKTLMKPSQFDISLFNYRRKLWLGVTIIRMSELLPNGCGSYLTTTVFLKTFMEHKHHNSTYMSAVVADSMSPDDFDIRLHDLFYKEYKMFIIWGQLCTTCSPLNESILLSSIHKIMAQCESRLNQLFPLSHLNCIVVDEDVSMRNIGKATVFPNINYSHIRAIKTFSSNLQGRLILLTIAGTLAHGLENKIRLGSSEYLEPYRHFTIESFRYCMELVKLLLKYLTGELQDSLPPKFGYFFNRILVFSLLRTCMSLTSLVIRLSFREFYLESTIRSESFLYENSQHSGAARQLGLTKRVKESIESLLISLIAISSRTVCRDHYGCHKTIAIFKYVAHLIEVGSLFDATNRLWDQILAGKEISETLRNGILFKLGIDLEESKALKEELFDVHVMEAFDDDVIANFYSSLDSLDLKNLSSLSTDMFQSERAEKQQDVFPDGMFDDSNMFSGDVLKYFDILEDSLDDISMFDPT